MYTDKELLYKLNYIDENIGAIITAPLIISQVKDSDEAKLVNII